MLTLRQSPFDLFNQLEQQLASAERVPAAEIVDKDDAYITRLELPGVDKGSIEIKATDRTLVVSAERSRAHSSAATSSRSAASGSDSNAANSQKANNHEENVAKRSTAEKADAEKEQNQPLLSEFRYGTWSRSFRFPQSLDRDQLKAVYRDGILEITAGKIRTQTTVSVEVES